MNLPPGIGKSFRLYGDGPGVSTILFTGPNAGINGYSMGLNTLNVEGLTLKANSYNCGTAIIGSFTGDYFRTATIQDVQIIGSARDGTSGFYWSNGIRLTRASHTTIDKVEIIGNKEVTGVGILWEGPASPTTGLLISDLQVKWCNTAFKTTGAVEGIYVTGFEFSSCGRGGLPAADLGASGGGSVAHLVNGRVDSVGSGIHLTNYTRTKVSNVSFIHTGEVTLATLLYIGSNTGNPVFDATVTECSFYGVDPGAVSDENGVFLNNVNSARIAGNKFTHMRPVNGSCILVVGNSSTVRITDNLFSDVRAQYFNQASDTYFFGNNPPP